LKTFNALNKTYYYTANYLLAKLYLLISTNPWSYLLNFYGIVNAGTVITKIKPSRSQNYLARYKFFDVDINPNISIKTPGCKLLKSRVLILAPLYKVCA
jgi:hypothetical protein